MICTPHLIHLVEAKLFHVAMRTDRRTDMAKLIVAFCNFVNSPKKKRNIHTLTFHEGRGGGSGIASLFLSPQ